MSARKEKTERLKKNCELGAFVGIDQLGTLSGLFKGLTPGKTPICLVEPFPELISRRYHKKRLVLALSMLRHFAEELRKEGYKVFHYGIEASNGKQLCEEGQSSCLQDFVKKAGIRKLRVMEANEYDADKPLHGLQKNLGLPVEVVSNDQFMVGRHGFRSWFESSEDTTVESFYRERRRNTDLLMEDGQPLGGRWNYDTDNRVPPSGNLPVPELPVFEPDSITRKAIEIVDDRFSSHNGSTSDFALPVTSSEAEIWLKDFLENRLRLFGMYQDAMLQKSSTMFHAFLSPYLNHGLINPRNLLGMVGKAYDEGNVPINSAEGFIRQILGWREYVHGCYWMRMPGMREENFLGFEREVPPLMDEGNTRLKCLKSVVEQSKREAYAHHIQRLMVVGNFALLTGVEPKALVEWYRKMYVDAVEWSALPNIVGVALYADGGSFGSKPSAASAHYINKMSDYCRGCYYKSRKRLGEKACPLNYLYWNFVATQQGQLRKNPRMQNAIQMYRLKPQAERDLIEKSSREFLARLDANGTDAGKKK
jgi:(6-4)DNA photolyase